MEFQFKHEPSAAYPNKEDPNHPENEHFFLWVWEHKLWLEAKGDVEGAANWVHEIGVHVKNAIEAKVKAFEDKLHSHVKADVAEYRAQLEANAKAVAEKVEEKEEKA